MINIATLKTTLYICWTVPLDNTYTHTIWFPDRATQLQYFKSKVKSTSAGTLQWLNERQTAPDGTVYYAGGISYQRPLRGYILTDTPATMMNTYDCNYLCFQPTSQFNPSSPTYEDAERKWFYAFITDIEYVNDRCTKINFEIDVMQTFMWNYNIRNAFVIREHCDINDDETGNFIESESGINTGEIIDRNYNRLASHLTDSYDFVLWTGDPQNNWKSAFFNANGLPSGVTPHRFGFRPNDDNSIQALNNQVQQFVDTFVSNNSVDSIVNAEILPGELFIPGGTVYAHTEVSLNRPNQISGYTPLNKKCLCYPYNFLTVKIGNVSRNYHYEYFQDPQHPRFKISTVASPHSQLAITPLNYLNVEENYDEEILFSNFAQVCLPISSALQWLNQSLIPDTITGGLSMAIGGASGSAEMVQSAGVSTLTNAVHGYLVNHNKGTYIKGNSSQLLEAVRGLQRPYYSNSMIKNEYVKSLDSYFQMYGYAVNLIKEPEYSREWLNGRFAGRKWCYIQCRNISYKWYQQQSETPSSMPSAFAYKINEIYNKGITFWRYGVEVGRYTQDDGTPILNQW